MVKDVEQISLLSDILTHLKFSFLLHQVIKDLFFKSTDFTLKKKSHVTDLVIMEDVFIGQKVLPQKVLCGQLPYPDDE